MSEDLRGKAFSFNRTLEVWKLSSKSTIQKLTELFQSNLRGMETFSFVVLDLAWHAFQSNLRGMETETFEWFSRLHKEFQSNLRGMETRVAWSRKNERSMFQSNLRGMETSFSGNLDYFFIRVSIKP